MTIDEEALYNDLYAANAYLPEEERRCRKLAATLAKLFAGVGPDLNYPPADKRNPGEKMAEKFVTRSHQDCITISTPDRGADGSVIGTQRYLYLHSESSSIEHVRDVITEFVNAGHLAGFLKGKAETVDAEVEKLRAELAAEREKARAAEARVAELEAWARSNNLQTANAVGKAHCEWRNALAGSFPRLTTPQLPEDVKPFFARLYGAERVFAEIALTHEAWSGAFRKAYPTLQAPPSPADVGIYLQRFAAWTGSAVQTAVEATKKTVDEAVAVAVNKTRAEVIEEWRTAFRRAGSPLGTEAGIVESIAAVMKGVAAKARERAVDLCMTIPGAKESQDGLFRRAFEVLGYPLGEGDGWTVQDAVHDVFRRINLAAVERAKTGNTDEVWCRAFQACGCPLPAGRMTVNDAVRQTIGKVRTAVAKLSTEERERLDQAYKAKRLSLLTVLRTKVLDTFNASRKTDETAEYVRHRFYYAIEDFIRNV